jgi:hypothetical protein
LLQYRGAFPALSKNQPGDEGLCRLRVEAASLLGIKDQQTKNREVASEKKIEKSPETHHE